MTPVTLQACIWKVSSSNLDWDIIHPKSSFFGDFSQFSHANAIITCQLFSSHHSPIILSLMLCGVERLRMSWKSSIKRKKIFNKICTTGFHFESHISSFLPHKLYLLHWALFNPFPRIPGSLHSWKCLAKILVSFYFSYFIPI